VTSHVSAPSLPILRWHGGKWNLAPWVVSHFPPHRVYVEPFGGAGSVLLRKRRAYAEIWNDLDGGAVNLFRVLRDPRHAAELIRRIELTPFARREFDNAAGDDGADPIESARRLVLRSFQGFGSNAHTGISTGFRANSRRSGTTPAHDWLGYPLALRAAVARLRGVIIENRPALQVIAAHDGADTLHYIDPPYVWATRSGSTSNGRPGNRYRHEMDDAAHGKLLAAIREVRGGGRSQRLSESDLRYSVGGLAACRAGRLCRRRPGARRGAVAQPPGLSWPGCTIAVRRR
jgi:DNA adenine methylase